MKWKVPGKRCSSGMQKATVQRPSRNSSLRSQKLVSRERKTGLEGKGEWTVVPTEEGKGEIKTTGRRREETAKYRKGVLCESSWKQAHCSLLQVLSDT